MGEQHLPQMNTWSPMGCSGQQEDVCSWPLHPCTGLTLTTPNSRLMLMMKSTPMSKKLESRSAARQGGD